MDSPSLSEADRYLLDQVRAGDADGWSQLVDKYQGRLLAFARARLANRADAEDLVQDTFINFLSGLARYRGDASLETYLFTILRRRIIDALRARKDYICQLRDSPNPDDDDAPAMQLASPGPTASWYARRDEAYEAHFDALAAALTELVDDQKQSGALETLMIAEAVFFAQLRNKEAARLIGVSENQVALTKHRWIKRLADRVDAALAEGSAHTGTGESALWQSPEKVGELMSDVWESRRLTCPKRSTLGRWMLGTLDEPWKSYVAFHAEQLGCRFCRANLDDLKAETESKPAPQMQQRILQSTIGFFKG